MLFLGCVEGAFSWSDIHRKLSLCGFKSGSTSILYINGIFKPLRSPGINSKESIPPAYVTRVGTTTPFLLDS